MRIEWSKYLVLTEENIRLNVQEKPGVYRLAEPTTEGNIWPFYVGQAENLHTRLLQHLSGSGDNTRINDTIRNKRCKFRFAYVQGSEERNCIERAMYDRYHKPRCNINVPPGKPCEVNFE